MIYAEFICQEFYQSLISAPFYGRSGKPYFPDMICYARDLVLGSSGYDTYGNLDLSGRLSGYDERSPLRGVKARRVTPAFLVPRLFARPFISQRLLDYTHLR